jgi:hypothetical protein
MGSWHYETRTRQNVLDSDGTVIFTRGPLNGGSASTARYCRDEGKPPLHIDLANADQLVIASPAYDLAVFIKHHAIRVLNVAGNRESKSPGIQAEVRRVEVLRNCKGLER